MEKEPGEPSESATVMGKIEWGYFGVERHPQSVATGAAPPGEGAESGLGPLLLPSHAWLRVIILKVIYSK